MIDVATPVTLSHIQLNYISICSTVEIPLIGELHLDTYCGRLL